MERAATCVHCPVASEVSGEVSEVSAMRKIGQLQGQRTRRPYSICYVLELDLVFNPSVVALTVLFRTFLTHLKYLWDSPFSSCSLPRHWLKCHYTLFTYLDYCKVSTCYLYNTLYVQIPRPVLYTCVPYISSPTTTSNSYMSHLRVLGPW